MTESLTIAGETVTIRAPEPSDGPALARFADAVPFHDLLFLARDIRHPKVIEAWLKGQESGEIDSLLAVVGDEIVATVAAHSDAHGWSSHVRDLRLLVSPPWRGKGLGRELLERAIAAARVAGASRLTARMTPDQIGAITLFEECGFRAEALLKGQVRDGEGRQFDLAVLGMDPARESARREAFGA